ncbi:MAG: hypothetical protein B9S32_06025 [Verrucomicrobia bacterium Tous-C9LFEB]|nr:MAG: hypothetical protein B9S32_06025 [Verrucomicrobia bacterium Tous-C9LFEB]
MGRMQPALDPALQPAIDLILEFEVGGGESYYNRHLIHPTQPTPSSGITIGIGYDLGQTTRVEFLDDWRDQLPDRDRLRLCAAIGLTHHRAAALLPALDNMTIPWNKALAVFHDKTLVTLGAVGRQFAFSFDTLPPDCRAALLSLLYNRGASTRGESRLEMREMQTALKDGLLDHIPVLIRSMKRLWIGKPGGPGLIRRREAEAVAFEKGLGALKAPDLRA